MPGVKRGNKAFGKRGNRGGLKPPRDFLLATLGGLFAIAHPLRDRLKASIHCVHERTRLTSGRTTQEFSKHKKTPQGGVIVFWRP